MLKPNDVVAKAVKVMLQESFSQIPIYDDKGFVALLTTNTVSRWLGSCLDVDILSLSETTVESVLKFSEGQENCSFLSRSTTVFDALEKFQLYQKDGKRLEAILITQNGKPSEQPLGIITIWDLPQIYGILEHAD
jgi:predicted transcriptional regulator